MILAKRFSIYYSPRFNGETLAAHWIKPQFLRQPFLVTEFLGGKTLRDRLREGTLDPWEATRVVQQICEALHLAHRRGFIHRDVKPGNILFDTDGRCRLADFGLALFEDEQDARRGEIAGTPSYMAPEQVRGDSHHLDGRADVWAVGAMLYEIWSGKTPFRAADTNQLFEEIRLRPAKPLSMSAEVPAEVNDIVMRCLRKDPEERFASAQELAERLEAWLRQSGSATDQEPSIGKKPRKSAGIIGAAILLATVGVVTWGAAGFSGPWGGENATTAAGKNAANAAAGKDRESQRDAQSFETVIPAASTALDGDIAVTLWNKEFPERRGIPLDAAFPLREGDSIRLDASLHASAHVYLFWITSEGTIPLYPGAAGDWDSLINATSQPTRSVSLPERKDEGWPLEVSQHVETILLLAHRQPLAPSDIAAILREFPVPERAPPFRLIRLDNKVEAKLRQPNLQAAKLDDDVQRARAFLAEKLEPRVDLLRAVGFFNPTPSVQPSQGLTSETSEEGPSR